ncbi:MAG TPA: CSLREA domain-containing protein [Chloroflexota bacterium]
MLALRLLSAPLLLALALLVLQATPVHAAAFTLNSTADGHDANPGDGVCNVNPGPPAVCSLRAAIEEINALGQSTGSTPVDRGWRLKSGVQ